MKIAVIGVTGRVGSRVASELLRRGHAVTGIARDVSKTAAREGLSLKPGDANNVAVLTPLLVSHYAVISALRFVGMKYEALTSAVKKAGVKRFLVVGGAGSLEVAPGEMLKDTPEFPAAWKPEAEAGARFLDLLKQEQALDWAFLSPSAEFAPGERTGKFRVGDDRLLTDATGKSHISMEDFAIAMADELERPAHHRGRFTVGY
ncbi:MAG: NAD(P)-dependent oxidoreductase [Gammaproteobacteria bacterium]|nr:NAD(P)-dependent oxidoreductase [Gammaproteobacteria bacterium]